VVRPPYPVVLRLYAIAVERWAELDATYASIDLIRLPPHRFLNLVWTWCLEHLPADKKEEWLYQMSSPLPGQEKKKPSASEIDADGEAFIALMQQQGKV
jgi:hypothetical protein